MPPYRNDEAAANQGSLQDAVVTLEGGGGERAVHVRLGECGGRIYLDLADAHWRAVEVGPDGWRITADPPVCFRRPRGLLPLPAPAPGGRIDELRPFVNVPDDRGWRLLVATLVQALRPRGPYPVLSFTGEHGSAKSTQARVFRSLIDPCVAPLRGEPRDLRDLMIAASSAWVVAYDNLSSLQPWLSDALCRLATGGGFATRELYSDADDGWRRGAGFATR
jgi:hypothetical protein